MDTLDLLHWLHQFAYNLTTAPESNLNKAMAMSEVVYEALDIMKLWSRDQQRQALDAMRSWLNGGELDGLDILGDHSTQVLLKPILKAILEKAPIELEM